MIARRLLATNRPGDRVLLLYPPGLEFIAAFFGALYAGIVAVPAYPPRNNSQVPRLEAIMDDANVVEALTTAKTLMSVRPFVSRHPKFGTLRWITTDDLDHDPLTGETRLAADGLALLQYTSGSTGTPKGVMVTHGNIVYNSRYIEHISARGPESRSVTWLPSFHDMGLIEGVLQPLYVGYPGVILPPVSFVQKPLRWLAAVSQYRATHIGGPNFGYELCVQKITEEQSADLDLSSLQCAYNGAEPLRADTLRRFAQRFAPNGVELRMLYPCYGLAEATLMVSGSDNREEPVFCTVDRLALERDRVTVVEGPPGPNAFELVSSGRMVLDTTVRIVHPETRRGCAPDEVGEVWVQGPTVCAGYWQRPDATRETFEAFTADGEGPYLRTGDLAFLHGPELFITGRAKDLIIVRGRNVYPQDIETVAEMAHDALRPGSGTAFSVERGQGEVLVLVQELQRQALKSPPVDEIAQAIVRTVADQLEVELAEIVLIKTGAIPKTSSGKLQRRKARELLLAGELDEVGRWTAMPAAPAPVAAPSSADPTPIVTAREPLASAAAVLADWIATRVAVRIKRAPTQIDHAAAFTAFGLDSLALVELSGELAEHLGRDVSPTLLYDYPSIERVSRHLTGLTHVSAARSATMAEPIAIVGLSCRLPAADTPEAFWRLLRDGVDAIGAVPAGRWPDGGGAPRLAGCLASIDRFDPEFFGISPREAAAIDPQHRLLLELTWEALESGGLAPDRLAGTATGVFVGISTQDYLARQFQAGVSQHTGSGTALSAAAGRLSYVFGFEGPSLAIDTACSSSLVAVHLAAQSLRRGESTTAIVGGVNLLIAPETSEAFAKAGMMASDGRCKAFDGRADGYVRSEGAVVIVLKPLSRAEADGDRIFGVVRGSAVNQDGRSNGLTAPNGPSQERVIRAALDDAQLRAHEISFVEAHGTGTSLGDPIEVRALGSVFAERREPLAIGSVKTNVGHLEAAAGLTGLLKAVLALRHDEIPPTLHIRSLNPHIPWSALPITVPVSRTPWPRTSGHPRRAGVSSFGFTGTNAHVIIEEAPVASAPSSGHRAGHVLPLSAKHPQALRELAEAYARRLASIADAPAGALELASVTATAANGRAHLDHRLAVQGEDAAALATALRARAAQPAAVHAGAAPPVAWLFTGQGSQRPGMGSRLYDTEPVFRQVIDRCDALFQNLPPAGAATCALPLRQLLQDNVAGQLDQTVYTQPALFAVECALAALWRHWGVMPAAVIGHSVGEFVAAAVAGVFSLEDGMRLVTARGRLMQALPPGGAMLSVFADEATVDAARRRESDVALAAVNAADEVVLSGAEAAIARMAAHFAAKGIGTRALVVSHAFHSALMAPAADAFGATLREVTFAIPRVPVISNVTGRVAGPEIATPEYWQQHVLAPVRFRDGLTALAALGITHHLELGPHPVLSSLGARERADARWWPSLRRGVDDASQMRETLAQLYEAGVAIDWAHATDTAAPRAALPTYPFQRERHWIDVPAATLRSGARHPVLGAALPDVASLPQTAIWQLDDVTVQPVWNGYVIGRQALMPASGYLDLVTAAARESLGVPQVAIDRVAIVDAERVVVDASLRLQVTSRRLGKDTADLTVHMRHGDDGPWTNVATARASRIAAAPAGPPAPRMPDLGVMFFNGADTGEHDTYRLVLETARFADRHGFSSVWVPERHYTAFGGLYPNPAVLMAALARETRRVRLMAGSIVLPLHHPFRAMEDWALVDNLSNGRAGISVAPGWNPDDFAMAPERYGERREQMFAAIPLLQRLWRGELVDATSGAGRPIRVRTYPSPVQPELPLCVTAAGNPASFSRAGEVGAHLLTHLLDQDAVELVDKIAVYREARAQAGHDPATGRVTVMVHTFLGDDVETVRELVRKPYCQYIRENVGLLKGLAYSRGTDFDVTTMAPQDLDEFVNFLYDRFFSTRALLGTPESTLPLVRQLSEASVNEIACLVDFGPPTSLVVRHLPHLARLREHIASPASRVAVGGASTITVATVQARCAETFAASQFYRRLQSRGIRLGESMQGAVRFWRRDDEALAELTPSAAGESRTAEVALQAFVAAIPSAAFSSASEGVFVTTALDGCEVIAPDRDVVWSHATITPHPKRDGFVGRVVMFDADGLCVAVLERVTVERVIPEGLAAASKDIGVYEVQWLPQPLNTGTRVPGGRWLVCADTHGVADRVATRLTAAGHAVIRASADAVPLEDPAAIAEWIERCGPLTGIVHGWAMNAPDTTALTDASLAAGLPQSVGALFHVTKALAAQHASTRLWVLTCNAQPAGLLPAPVSVAQSTVWGFGRALAVEHPELWGGAIDLPETPDDASLDGAANAMLEPDGEDQMAWRDGDRYVPRLMPSVMPGVSTGVFFDPSAAYLITGGIGGLGRHVARWMLDEGVTDLVLTGLRARGDDAAPADLTRPGVRVDVMAADASDRAAMAALLAGIAARGKTLKGVVHLAGLPEERPIVDSHWTHGQRVMSPKVAGGWVVHDLTRAMPLDFFVTFSSISAVWGSRGQPFYGAANHFLDGLTAYRRASGLPAVTVSWGPWADGGMVSADGLALLEKMGLHAMPPAHAMERLTRLMAAQASPRVVVDVHWPVFKELFEARGARPMLERVGAGGVGAGVADTPLARELRALEPGARRASIGAVVYHHVADVLGWSSGRTPDTRRGFFDLGMDSLMALDLKNRLQDGFGVTLRATVVFNYSTVDALADFLDTQFGGDAAVRSARPSGSSTSSASSATPDAINALSDEETLRLLEQQLASIDGADGE